MRNKSTPRLTNVPSALTLTLATVMILAAAACSRVGTPRQAPDRRQDQVLLEEANRLKERASFVSLKKAFALFEGLSTRPSLRDAALVPYLETSLLLAVRGKDLGIGDPVPLAVAERLIRGYRVLSRFRPFFDIAVLLPVKTKGVLTDIDNKFSWSGWGRIFNLRSP